MIPFTPPFNDQSLAWLSVDRVAEIWHRSPRLIRNWCVDGTLLAMGAKVYRDKGRWWIGVPHSEVPAEVAAPGLTTLTL